MLIIPEAQCAMVCAIFQQRVEHFIDGLIKGREGATIDTRLAMNADAKLHLIIRQGKRRFARGRNGTGTESDTN